jgi:hypothetical protein
MVVARGQADRGFLFNEYRVSVFIFLRWQELWRWIVVTVTQHYECVPYHSTVHSRVVTINSMFMYFSVIKNVKGKRSDC